MKQCTVCGIFKNNQFFRQKHRGNQTHENLCKTCQSARETRNSIKTVIALPNLNVPQGWNLQMTTLNFFNLYRNIEALTPEEAVNRLTSLLNGIQDNRTYWVNCEALFTFNKYSNNANFPIRKEIRKFRFQRNRSYTFDYFFEFDEVAMHESGLAFVSISCIDVVIYQSNSNLAIGGSYVSLPPEIEKTNSVLNIKNDDNKCFLWSLLAYFFSDIEYNKLKTSLKDLVYLKRSNKKFYTENKNLYLKYVEKIKIKKYPVSIDDLPQIEEENKISLKVFELNEYVLDCIYDSKVLKGSKINLLLYKNHFMLITNISLSLSSGKAVASGS